MFSTIWNACKSIFKRVQDTIKKFTKPVTVSLVTGAISDMTRSSKDLVVENAILRQQLIVLKRVAHLQAQESETAHPSRDD